MPFSTLRQLPDAIAPVAGVLIKHRPMSQAVRAENLMREARRRAQELVRKADEEAEACRRQAALFGYEEGFRLVAAQLADYLAQAAQLQMMMRERIVDDVTQALSQFMSDPAFLERLADAFAAGNGVRAEMPVRVTLPAYAKRIAPSVHERFARAHPTVDVSCAEIGAFIVEWGEDILEFSPYDVAQRLSGAANASCMAAVDEIDLAALSRDVIAGALRELADAEEAPDPSTDTDYEEERFDDQLHSPD